MRNAKFLGNNEVLVVINENDKVSLSRSKKTLSTILVELKALGFAPSAEMLDLLMHCRKEALVEIGQNIITEIKRELWADKEFTFLFPDFPTSEEEEFDMVVIQLMHYICKAVDYAWLPKIEEKEK